MPQADLPLQRAQLAIRAAAVFLAVLGTLVLAGWYTNSAVLKGVIPGLPTMKANSATAMLLCGLALALLTQETPGRVNRLLISGFAVVVLLMGVSSLGEDIFDWDSGIDEWLLRDLMQSRDTIKTGRMAPPTAFCFSLAGLALLLMANWTPNRHQLAVVFALAAVVCMIGVLTLIAHSSSYFFRFHFWNYGGMAVNTALGFTLLGGALICLVRCRRGLGWAVDKVSTSGFVVGIFSLLAVASISYSLTWQLTQDAARVSHEQEVLKRIEEVKSGMADLENFQRGFILTGDEKLNAPVAQIRDGIASNIEFLRILLADNLQQLQTLTQLQALIQRRHVWEDETILVRRQNGLNAAQQLIMTRTGIGMSEKLHDLLLAMQASEYIVLEHEQQQSARTSNKTFLLLPMGVFMSLTLLTMGLAFLNSGLTAGKKAEQERRESETWFRNLFETTLDGIIIVDAQGRIEMANLAANRMFGLGGDSLRGTRVNSLLAPTGREQTMAHWGLPAGGVPQQVDAQRQDGSEFPIEWTRSAWSTARGRFTCVIMRDITERRQLELQLRQSQKMEAVGQLTGGIAHDFNNLLGIILGNLDLLERMVASDSGALKRVQTAQSAATRGANLTRRMLAFSSQQALKPVPTLLEEPIRNFIEMTSRALGPDIRLSSRLDAGLPPVLVDVAGLENVLLNLAVNARDAMPRGGTILISSELSDLEPDSMLVQAQELPAGRYARITVTDNGCGMTRATQERVFEPFFTTKPRGKGTGLGMAMVYGFIQRSGGMTRIYSEVGHGTSVSLYLPLAPEALVPQPAVVPLQDTRLPGGTVLVVDDEVNLLEIAVIYLEEMGMKVFHATDGPSALAVFEREPDIDLLVTDIIMPGGMNGVELADMARQKRPGLKVVFSSGFPSDALAERSGAKIEGALLNKPYERDEFARTIFAIMSPETGAAPQPGLTQA